MSLPLNPTLFELGWAARFGPYTIQCGRCTCTAFRFFTFISGNTGNRNSLQSSAPISVKYLDNKINMTAKEFLNRLELHLSSMLTSFTPPLTDPSGAPSIYALHATRISRPQLQKCPTTKSSKCCNHTTQN